MGSRARSTVKTTLNRFHPLHEDGALEHLAGRWGRRALGRFEDAQVDEPGARVELGVDGVDEPLLRVLLVGVPLRLHDYDAGDLLRLLAFALGEPADGDLGVMLVLNHGWTKFLEGAGLRCCSCCRGSGSRME